jgi:Isochorismatase family
MLGTAGRYDPSTALIVVDLQNDFADPAGSLYVREGEMVVPVANTQIGVALEAGALVVYTQDWHPPSTPHFEKDGGLWPVHCVQDSWGAAFHPDLRVEGDVVRKGSRGEDGYSAFSVRDAQSGATAPTMLQGLRSRHRLLRGGDGDRRARPRVPRLGAPRGDPRGRPQGRCGRPGAATDARGRRRRQLRPSSDTGDRSTTFAARPSRSGSGSGIVGTARPRARRP